MVHFLWFTSLINLELIYSLSLFSHPTSGCLAKDPSERPVGRACLGQPWLREERSGPSILHRLETLRMRRFLARYRWRRAIREVRMLVKVRNSFLGIPEDLE